MRHTDASRIDQPQDRIPMPINAPAFYLDDTTMIANHAVNPFELPPQDKAVNFLEAYTSTVQNSYPILSGKTAKDLLYQRCTPSSHEIPSAVLKKQLTILNLVFTIGARYLQLTHSGYQKGDYDHELYWSRAHILGLDESSLIGYPDLVEIQITALHAFYFLCIGSVNR